MNITSSQRNAGTAVKQVELILPVEYAIIALAANHIWLQISGVEYFI